MVTARIDAHHHLWRPERGDYPWMTPDMEVLRRDYLPEDLRPHLEAHGIDGTVLVQAAPTVAESEWLLSLADGEARDFVRGVVGWVDMDDPDAARFQIDVLSGHPLFRGIRPMIQDIEDADWMLQEGHGAVYQELVRRGLTFDALVKPQHLANTIELAHRYPSVRIVVDHCGKPTIGTGRGADAGFAAWSEAMGELGRADNTVVKFSALVTETTGGWTTETLRPYVEVMLAAFSPDRVMWGSDWPVLLEAGTYDTWRAASLELIAELGAAEKDRILGGTAVELYGLEP